MLTCVTLTLQGTQKDRTEKLVKNTNRNLSVTCGKILFLFQYSL